MIISIVIKNNDINKNPNPYKVFYIRFLVENIVKHILV